MSKILGYGEDTLTYWALRKRISEILKELNDPSVPSDCLIFFRPSFGRGKEGFGEFDAILASSEDVYLIESKWDKSTKDEIKLDKKQILRHKIFSWYFVKWDAQRYKNWKEFSDAHREDFTAKFACKKIVPEGKLLAQNLEYILNKLHKHCKKVKKPRNILLYFYGGGSKRATLTRGDVDFEVINIDYGQYTQGNFIPLD